MPEFQFGPVEFYLIGLEGARPDGGAVQALRELADSGLVRLMDFVLISKDTAGELTRVEVDDDPHHFGLDGVELAAAGIAGDTDIADFAELIPAGTSAVLAVIELAFQRKLAGTLAASGAVLLGTERVPAPVVNAVFDAIEDAEEGD